MARKTKEEFISQAEEVHGKGKYDYSLVEYKNNITKVKIICPEHNIIFEKTPSSHIYGKSGCRLCGGIYKAVDKQSFIAEAKKRHGNKYDYSYVHFENTKHTIKFYCNTCNNFFYQSANSHLSNSGCKYCSKNAFKKTTETFIRDAVKVHGDKYDYSKSNYIDAKHKVIITCKQHGDFEQNPSSHVRGQGCGFCNPTGYRVNKRGIFYIVEWYGYCESFIKFGITNKTVEERIERQYKQGNLDYKILYCFYFKDGAIPLKIETQMLRDLDCGVCPKQWLPDGYTETTHVDNLPKILNYIKTNYGLNPEDYKYKE